MKEPEKTLDIWITLYPQVLSALDEYALEHGYKRSELIREICRDWLDERRIENNEVTHKRKR